MFEKPLTISLIVCTELRALAVTCLMFEAELVWLMKLCLFTEVGYFKPERRPVVCCAGTEVGRFGDGFCILLAFKFSCFDDKASG